MKNLPACIPEIRAAFTESCERRNAVADVLINKACILSHPLEG